MVGEKSTEDPRNFLKATSIIPCVRDTGGYLNVWNHLFEAKDAFPDIRMIELGSPGLKKLIRLCAGRVTVLLHPSLYSKTNIAYDRWWNCPGWTYDAVLGTGSLG